MIPTLESLSHAAGKKREGVQKGGATSGQDHFALVVCQKRFWKEEVTSLLELVAWWKVKSVPDQNT